MSNIDEAVTIDLLGDSPLAQVASGLKMLAMLVENLQAFQTAKARNESAHEIAVELKAMALKFKVASGDFTIVRKGA